MKLAAAHPWPDTSETQRETSSDDNYFDKHRLGGGAEFMVTERISVFAQGAYTSLDTSFLAKDLTALEDDEDTGLESEIGLVQANVGVNFHF